MVNDDGQIVRPLDALEASEDAKNRVARADKGALQEPYNPEQPYTGVRAFSAEGARVGLVSCLTCGAALLVDPADTDFNVFEKHDRWHRSLEVMHGYADTPEGQAQVTVRRQR